MRPEVSIIIPCLNEENTIGGCIRKAANWLTKKGITGEILVADNGSTDNSKSIALEQNARVIDVKEKGYGAACRQALKYARGKYIILGDADGSYDFSSLDIFLDKLNKGFDVVIGNRFKGGISPGAMPWANRYIGNPVLSFIGKILFNVPVSDFHCGLRAFNTDSVKALNIKATGMEFSTELIVAAKFRGLTITEVPTTLSKDGRNRPPHLRPWRDGWLNLKTMLVMYYNDRSA